MMVPMPIEMNYCMQCGTKLEKKFLEGEGEVPYCSTCADYRFPVFNTAVSMIVRDPKGNVLLVKQYGRDSYILVAGYVNKGEDAEHAVAREVEEEMGLHITGLHFNHSHYFAPSNTLMLNWTVTIGDEAAHPNREIDSYAWFTPVEARRNIRQGSLAEEFLVGYLDQKWSFRPR